MCSAALQRSVIMAKRQNQISIVGFINETNLQSQSDIGEVYDNASLIESESSTNDQSS